MTTSTPAICPRCGAPIPAGPAERLCAACLLLQALEAETDTETELRSPEEFTGPSRQKTPPASTDLPCDFGGYRLIRLLGRGGMGSVYEAEQLSTGRRLALKMLSQQLESPVMRARFLREGRLAAGISHPNSLYVFGTEEIDGIPVITMEIADSGTLADRLKTRGPLTVVDAVDVVLGLITGLEAAHAAGVLHRDVKPSNVFVSPDGTVKIGDYGLSVSTIETVDSFTTATGVALGTPAYAAPEQLRGDELDVRADIYSVGATLFTLLTDHAPIEGKNAVQIVAAALDEKPKLLSELRRDVPGGLAQVVARCLAKKPEQRYRDYAELRGALLPFSSETPQPAPLPKRAVAYAIDEMLSWYIPGLCAATYFGVSSLVELPLQQQFRPGLLLLAWFLAYYVLPEGRWGAGLGKRFAGIRVARSNGQPPDYLRALARALMAWTARQGGTIFVLSGIGISTTSYLANAIAYLGFSCGLMLAPLLTMRRRNGYAIAWDLFTNTRVIERPSGIAHALIDVKRLFDTQSSSDIKRWLDGTLAPQVQDDAPCIQAEYIGPYLLVQQLVPGWMTAFDSALHRPVWLLRRERDRDADQLSPSRPLTRPTSPATHGKMMITRRNVARPGRARWLQSITTSDANWDVFEALPGMSLARLLDQESRPHWAAVRHWLYELTIEIAQASEDMTLPTELSLDHVWITHTGRAMILDERWPVESHLIREGEIEQDHVAIGSDPINVEDIAGKQRFLDSIAKCTDPTTIPIHAQSVLQNLAVGSFDKLSFLAGCLRSFLNKPARLDRTIRTASLFAIPVALIALGGFDALLVTPALNRARVAALNESYPDLPALSDVLRFRERLVQGERDHDFINLHLAGHYDIADFNNLADYQRYRLLSQQERNALKQAFYPPLEFTPEQLKQADRKLSEALPEFQTGERQINRLTVFRLLVESSLRLVFVIALVQLVTLALLATTAGQHLFGFAVVDAKSQPAGRVRLLVRWLIAWTPFFLVLPFGMQGDVGWALLLLVPWIIGLAVAVLHPSRGLHDQLSGCWLVPR